MRLTMALSVLAATFMAASPSGTARAEDAIAVGAVFGAADATGAVRSPFIMRWSNGTWQRASLATSLAGNLLGLTRTPTGALWAYGISAKGALVVESDDRGVTWRDVSDRLPADEGGVLELEFVGSNGIALTISTSGAARHVLVSADEGKTWTLREERAGTAVRVGTFGGAVVLVGDDGTGALVAADGARREPIEVDAGTSMTAIGTSPGAFWLAASRSAAGGRDAVLYRKAEHSGADARLVVRDAEFYATAFDDAHRGLVGGFRSVGGAVTPFVAYTNDDGQRWNTARIPVSPATGIVRAVAIGGTQAWALSNNLGAAGCSVLRSGDGGATWSVVPSPADRDGRIRALLVL